MTEEEILKTLRVNDLSEVFDALELELFEIKKNILGKPLLRQTLKSKLLRLKILAQIAVDQNLFQNDSKVVFKIDSIETDEVLKLWESYMHAKNYWKMMLSQMQSPEQIEAALEDGLKIEGYFTNQFPTLNWTDEEPVFGIEPDPMLIQNGLKNALERGWITFADLEKNKGELKKDLLLALKRLSLLPKYVQ
ncbi:hypothetical protein [Fluviicola taffensis]|uniref:Uncharacterized protein n=1 Tax=Fluviicola taffensis (strain DSM 16823 / NCIMB 13979 / RW262) TaxID=755732 RepID=F2ICQ6_FLUTR|nr:hypothetical protein [Fluviicola taffensis]AEA42283.1 hypothetical protein Fluta_0274 [Fluviicola taffensis DSM 16823]